MPTVKLPNGATVEVADASTASTIQSEFNSLQSRADAADEMVDKAKFDELQGKYDAMAEEMAKLKEAKEEKADALVQNAVNAGRIAPKDAVTAAFWRKSILENPQAVEVLNGLPVRIDGQTIIAKRVESAPSIREISKSEFDKLSPAAKSTFSQEGGRIIG